MCLIILHASHLLPQCVPSLIAKWTFSNLCNKFSLFSVDLLDEITFSRFSSRKKHRRGNNESQQRDGKIFISIHSVCNCAHAIFIRSSGLFQKTSNICVWEITTCIKYPASRCGHSTDSVTSTYDPTTLATSRKMLSSALEIPSRSWTCRRMSECTNAKLKS